MYRGARAAGLYAPRAAGAAEACAYGCRDGGPQQCMQGRLGYTAANGKYARFGGILSLTPAFYTRAHTGTF